MITDKTEVSVLVTGTGAIIGQGIIKSLRKSKYSVRLVGVDRSNRSPAPYLCDAFHQKPPCEDETPDCIAFWRDILTRERVDIVMPGLEVDVFFLDAQRQLFKQLGVTVVINRSELIALSADKWKLGEELADIGLPNIPASVPENWEQAVSELGTPPLLLKPRSGNGSRGIARLYDEIDFDYWRAKSGDNWMLQRIVGDDCNEFTVGVFGFGDGESIAPITLKRRLSGAGNTLEAQVVNDSVIEEATQRLTRYFKPLGPTNYQFRKEGDIAYLLEINPRFSSSNSLRTAFGFNEAEMAIDYFKFRRSPQIPLIKAGTAWRYSEDFVNYASSIV
jgi:carbamoyl-phosphate synthase large subunit